MKQRNRAATTQYSRMRKNRLRRRQSAPWVAALILVSLRTVETSTAADRMGNNKIPPPPPPLKRPVLQRQPPPVPPRDGPIIPPPPPPPRKSLEESEEENVESKIEVSTERETENGESFDQEESVMPSRDDKASQTDEVIGSTAISDESPPQKDDAEAAVAAITTLLKQSDDLHREEETQENAHDETSDSSSSSLSKDTIDEDTVNLLDEISPETNILEGTSFAESSESPNEEMVSVKEETSDAATNARLLDLKIDRLLSDRQQPVVKDDLPRQRATSKVIPPPPPPARPRQLGSESETGVHSQALPKPDETAQTVNIGEESRCDESPSSDSYKQKASTVPPPPDVERRTGQQQTPIPIDILNVKDNLDVESDLHEKSKQSKPLPPPPPPPPPPLDQLQRGQQTRKPPVAIDQQATRTYSVDPRQRLQQQQQRRHQKPHSMVPPRVSQRTAYPQQGVWNPQQQQGPQQSYHRPQRHSPRPYMQQAHQQYYSKAHRQRPPPAHRTQQQSVQTLKLLWRRIERGLDGLANVEDAVSDRAQQLYSSTVSAVKVLPTVKVPSVKIPVRRKIEKEKPQPPEQLDLSRFRRKTTSKTDHVDKAATGESDSRAGAKAPEAISPYGVVFQKTIVQLSDKIPEANKPSVTTSRKIDWNSIRSGQRPVSGKTSRLIRANGGASTPHGTPQSTTTAVSNNGDIPVNATRTAAQFEQRQGAGQTSTYQSSTVQPSPPKAQGVPLQSHQLTQGIGNSGSTPMTSKQSQWRAQASRPSQPQPKPPPRRPFPDDDDRGVSFMSKLGRFVPPIPRIKGLNPFRRRSSRDFANAVLDAWRADDEESAANHRRGILGVFRKPSEIGSSVPFEVTTKEQTSIMTPPMADLMERCGEGEAASLLNSGEKARCRLIGRQEGGLDFLFLAFIIVGLRHLPDLSEFQLPRSVVEALTTTITDAITFLAASTDTWAPYAFAAAFLTIKTKTLLCDSKEQKLVNEVDASIRDEAQYGSLFLRLLTSSPLEIDIPERMQAATRAQVASKVDIARVQSFVGLLLVTLVLATASSMVSLLAEVLLALPQVVMLEQWRTWPPQGSAIATGIKSAILPVLTNVRTTFHDAINAILNHPLKFAYMMSVFAALVSVAFLPMLESRRRTPVDPEDREIDEEEEEKQMHIKFTGQISGSAASGANRLNLLSVDGQIESVLERWRMMAPRGLESSSDIPVHSVFRLVCYCALSGVILVAPLLLYTAIGFSSASPADGLLPRWDSLLDASIVIFFTLQLVWNTLSKTVRAADEKDKINSFVSSLVSTVEERKKLLLAPPANLQLQASVSPTAGVQVKDLWVSHAKKRAWAVRGATFTCKNGEVLLVLGDDGAGKTRLITHLVESMVSPPKRAMTTVEVRGIISVGGVDVEKWDNKQLKRRIGVALNDVRTVSDTAQILTGLSLEEILVPCDGLRHLDPSYNPGPSERSAMMLALKITGLYSTLLRRLPSKMSTIVTANEEDLNPSPLRPRYQILSAAEWSKLLLTKVLAQAIFDNDNSAGTNDAVANSLVGSTLLLDDVTLHLSEVEEARLLRDLRESGAATIVSSNRWATGRFADRIAVVKDGAIVESGTHTELLNRGPQRSMYAAKWYAMSQ